jgi:prepilin signal peptidase PulO-like enzyme (type II secretory pathway)
VRPDPPDRPEGPPAAAPGLPWRGTIAYAGEALALLLAVAVVVQWPTAGGFVTAAIVAAMVYAATVDLIAMRIPNAVTYPGTLVVLAAAAVAGLSELADAVLGALVAGGVIGVIALLARGKMGMGDVKLCLLGGALVGVDYALPAMLIGSLSALPVAGILLLARRIDRRQAIPYGPYLALGFVAVTLIAGSVLTG